MGLPPSRASGSAAARPSWQSQASPSPVPAGTSIAWASGQALSGQTAPAAATPAASPGSWRASLGQPPGPSLRYSVQGASGRDSASFAGSGGVRSSAGSAAVELSGYLTTRAMDRRTVDSDELDALRRCGLTMSRTRSTLSHGRGNVAEDLAATDWRNLSRVATADRYFEQTILPEVASQASNLAQAEMLARASLATTAAFLGAGNCGAHAELATHYHASSLRPGTERVYVQSRAHADGSTHEWAEMSGGPAGRVIMDAWSKGPPVLAEDSVFSSDFQPQSGGREYLHEDAASIQQAMRERWSTLQTRDAPALRSGASRTVSESDREVIAPRLPTPASVLDPSFASRISDRFRFEAGSEGSGADGASLRRSLNQEILAAGAARSMGSRIDRRSAGRLLPAIIESARRLADEGSGA